MKLDVDEVFKASRIENMRFCDQGRTAPPPPGSISTQSSPQVTINDVRRRRQTGQHGAEFQTDS
jgi:hypothetical protein